MLGDEYISQHILNEVHRENEELAYRAYVTDTLYLLCNGSMKRRWIDIMEDMKKPQDNRSAEEIKNGMLKKLNGG